MQDCCGKEIQSKRRWVDRSYNYSMRKLLELTEHSASVIHAYEDGAAVPFKDPKSSDRRSYELPIAHWKTVRLLLSEEAEDTPNGSPLLNQLVNRKVTPQEKELSLAVASSAQATLSGSPFQKK